MLLRRISALLLISVIALACRSMGDYYAADRDFRRKDYPYSIIRYERFLERNPQPSNHREVALIRLAQSYQAMREFTKAERAFALYEQEYPEGRFAEATREALAGVRGRAAEREKKLAQSIASARQESERLLKELEQKPKNPELLLALGNTYWTMGQYKSAGESYLKAIEQRPALRENELLSERLFFDLSGRLVVVSPEERVALERELEPLAIENVHAYDSRGPLDFFASSSRYYIVTGAVRNRSTRPLMGVQVEVTIYDPLEQILEVGTAQIGTLYPQQSRPFVVKSALDAEAMNNIARYRVRPLFQQ